MSKECTLIKNSELNKLREELKNNVKIREELIKTETENIRKEIEIRDKEIIELKAQIKSMEENPKIDPLKMEIYMMEKVVHSGRYDLPDERLPYVSIYPINFNLDDKLLKQVKKIAKIISERDVKITIDEVNRLAYKIVDKEKIGWIKLAYEKLEEIPIWKVRSFIRNYKKHPTNIKK